MIVVPYIFEVTACHPILGSYIFRTYDFGRCDLGLTDNKC